MSPTVLRRTLLILLVVVTVLVAFLLSGCGITEYQRFADRADAARADLYSPAMEARIAEARR